MATINAKNAIASFWMETGESWVFYSATNPNGYTPQTYSYDSEDPYVSTNCYASDKLSSMFSSSDYILYAVQTNGQDPTVNNPTPVIALGPEQENVTTLPFQGSVFENVIGMKIDYDEGTRTYAMWYFVYGWTDNSNSNTNVLASAKYSDDTAVDFDPTNWWVVPQSDDSFSSNPKVGMVLLFTTGKKVLMDGNLPYLVFDFPKVSQTYSTSTNSGSCCISFVQASSLTPDPTTGFYPGNVFTYDIPSRTWSMGDSCWIVNANP